MCFNRRNDRQRHTARPGRGSPEVQIATVNFAPRANNKGNQMRAFILLVVTGFTACTTDRVVVDPRGLNRAAYEKDLAECRALKHQVPVGEEMARGAAVGAAVGGLVGAAAGNSTQAAEGAATGAVVGATEKMVESSEEKAGIVKNCLRGRGYEILN